jgi:NAD(P)H-quinone oxidoreductase subunit 5
MNFYNSLFSEQYISQNIQILVLLVLVLFLGFIIIRYSINYLDNEPNKNKFLFLILITLIVSSIFICTNNLLMIFCAWFVLSFSINQLLRFYPDRPLAIIAAKKKLFVSLLANFLFLAGIYLIYTEFNTFNIELLPKQVSAVSEFAFVLIAFAVVLKSAQIPFHGWIIQVMEAPTPVSALLHAGVVNLGGILLIKLQYIFQMHFWGQFVLLVFGSITLFLASLTMLTATSIKVRLAWSTCAQMAFMLVECALGLYDMALLHIVGHSLYKAYSFLTCGFIVTRTIEKRIFGNISFTNYIRTFFAPVLAGFLIILFAQLWQQDLRFIMIALLSFAISPLFWHKIKFIKALILVNAFFLLHNLFSSHNSVHSFLNFEYITTFVLTSLYCCQIVILFFNHKKSISKFYHLIYNGFYLDSSLTKLVLNTQSYNLLNYKKLFRV